MTRFDDLLAAMPRIAEAVDGFTDPALRRHAFDRLVDTALGDDRYRPAPAPYPTSSAPGAMGSADSTLLMPAYRDADALSGRNTRH